MKEAKEKQTKEVIIPIPKAKPDRDPTGWRAYIATLTKKQRDQLSRDNTTRWPKGSRDPARR